MAARALTKLIRSRGSVVIDGAMSTALEKLGCNLNDSLWSARILLDEPEKILQVHRDYFACGANVAITASYQATEAGYRNRGIPPEKARSLIMLSAALALQAKAEYLVSHPGTPAGDLIIAGAVGPYGAYLADGSEYTGAYSLTDSEYRAFHRLRLEALIDGGADFIAIETMPRLDEIRSLLGLLGEYDTSAWVTCTLRDDGRLPDGTPIEEVAAACADNPQVEAVGLNCIRRELAAEALRRIASATDKPLIVYPNSGERYDPSTKTWHHPVGGPGWSEFIGRWHSLGALCLGGCCRTLPSDITEIARLMKEFRH